VASASDRLFSIGMNNGGGTLDASGTGALSLTNAGAMGFVDSGPHTLTRTGTNVGNNILSAAITDNGGPTTIIKTGPGQWILKGTNTATGGLVVSNGSLLIGGSLVFATATNCNVPSGTG